MYRSMTIISGSCLVGRASVTVMDSAVKRCRSMRTSMPVVQVPFAASSRSRLVRKAVYLPSTTSRDDYDTECASTESAPCKSDDAVGGNAMAVASLERLPQRRLSAINTPTRCVPSVFMDMGTVWDTNWDSTKYGGYPDYSDPSNIHVCGYRGTVDVAVGAGLLLRPTV